MGFASRSFKQVIYSFLLLVTCANVLDEKVCDPDFLTMSLQNCVPQYLVDLWQQRGDLTLSSGNGHTSTTSSIFQSNHICLKISEFQQCADVLINGCSNQNQTTRDSAISSISPLYSPIAELCNNNPSQWFKSCSSSNIERCLNVLPHAKSEGITMDRKIICPLSRVASSCLDVYTDCDDTKKNAFDNAISSLSNGSEPFFYCKAGWGYTGYDDDRITVVDQNLNTSFKQEVAYHCESAHDSCKFLRIYYQPKPNQTDFVTHEFKVFGGCSNCGNYDCSAGNYYNLKTMDCATCPVGWYQGSSGKLSCSPCDETMTTDSEGSSKKSQCVVSGSPNNTISSFIVAMCLFVKFFKF